LPSYDVYARFYDALEGDRTQHARYLRSLIKEHAPRARTLLELACGTGLILKQLWTHYEVTGLDLSEEMLERAAERLPGVPLFRGDMRSFELNERFDVVLCVYDSINHLLRFDDWLAVFARARDHLNDEGVFIFERIGDSEYRLHSENIREISFPLLRIKEALQKLFSRVRVYDAQRARPSAASQRLHFVCRA
jgi:trans-aconitate methyltransferase